MPSELAFGPILRSTVLLAKDGAIGKRLEADFLTDNIHGCRSSFLAEIRRLGSF